MAYPDAVRQQARALYMSGEISSPYELATRIGCSPTTVKAWIDAEDWGADRDRVAAIVAGRLGAAVADEIESTNARYRQIWTAVLTQIVTLIRAAHEAGAPLPLDDLDRCARVIERAQRGHGIALGVGADWLTAAKAQEVADAVTRAAIEDLTDEEIEAELGRIDSDIAARRDDAPAGESPPGATA